MVLNSKATYAEINKLLGTNGWLKRKVKDNPTDIIIYFAGFVFGKCQGGLGEGEGGR